MGSTALDRSQVESLVRQVLRERLAGRIQPPPSVGASHTSLGSPSAHPVGGVSQGTPPHPLVVNVSARHVHVTQADLEILFGPGSKLTKLKDLYQAGEFASEQLVTLVGPRQRIIPNVRILGPCRNYTQVELSYTDGVYLGVDLPLRISGDHQNSPGITLLGPAGALSLSQGVIRAKRHVHMSEADMKYYNVRDGDRMKLRIDGPCGLTFDHVVVRYHPKVILEVHIDTDEGNACDLESATGMSLIR
jgi:propanediol utilization protein